MSPEEKNPAPPAANAAGGAFCAASVRTGSAKAEKKTNKP